MLNWPKMKLTDLNIDCLENVLGYLELGDLINAADANKRLNEAANFVFVRKYNRANIRFLPNSSCFGISYKKEDKYMYVKGLKVSLQLLRCFGHLISGLACCLIGKHHHHIINYINEYCSESLKKIEIRYLKIGWETQLKKPFSNIEDVTFSFLEFNSTDWINRLFPKMRTLDTTGYFVNANHFANLEELILSGFDENLVLLLRLNPQLKFLRIEESACSSISSELSTAFETLTNLESLFFNIGNLANNVVNHVIHLKSVTTLTLCRDALKIPFSCGQLKNLTLCNIQINHTTFRFLNENPTISHLRISHFCGFGALDATDSLRLAKSLPLLRSIYIDANWSADEAIDFMSKLEHLERFEFELRDTTTYEDIQTRIGNGWKCAVMNDDRNFFETISVTKQQANGPGVAVKPICIQSTTGNTIWRPF